MDPKHSGKQINQLLAKDYQTSSAGSKTIIIVLLLLEIAFLII